MIANDIALILSAYLRGGPNPAVFRRTMHNILIARYSDISYLREALQQVSAAWGPLESLAAQRKLIADTALKRIGDLQ